MNPPLCGPAAAAHRWCEAWQADPEAVQTLLLLAATQTAAVAGISAAGSTPASRRLTAAADAELLLLGPLAQRPHALPPLPAGVSPALISHVVLRTLALDPLVVDLGCAVAPAVPHVRLAACHGGGGAARCLSGGDALPAARVQALLALGSRWGAAGRSRRRPLLLAECVPGGTSTAQAVLTGLGLPVAGLVSGSLREPAHDLKQDLVRRGLACAALPVDGSDASLAQAVLAAVGDPMQAVAAGLVLAAVQHGRWVLLAGGSQMAAVFALALALAPPPLRPLLAAHCAVATTAWVAHEPGSDLARLLGLIAARWGVEPLAFAAGLRFAPGHHPALQAYEQGYVKEGVGAGGLALLWELSGRSPAALALACDRACHQLLPLPAAPRGER
jgi:uncharacterized protein (TIGR00303 family)